MSLMIYNAYHDSLSFVQIFLGLLMHASILAFMFSVVEHNVIKVPLDTTNPNATYTDNARYVQRYVANLLKTAFPHLTDHQVQVTVQGMNNLNQDLPGFRDHLRDFMVQIRVSYLRVFHVL